MLEFKVYQLCLVYLKNFLIKKYFKPNQKTVGYFCVKRGLKGSLRLNYICFQ